MSVRFRQKKRDMHMCDVDRFEVRISRLTVIILSRRGWLVDRTRA